MPVVILCSECGKVIDVLPTLHKGNVYKYTICFTCKEKLAYQIKMKKMAQIA